MPAGGRMGCRVEWTLLGPGWHGPGAAGSGVRPVVAAGGRGLGGRVVASTAATRERITDEGYARALDAADQLAGFRERFFLP